MTYLAVNPDNTYKLFSSLPQRIHKPVLVDDYTRLHEDNYGEICYEKKETGEYIDFWAIKKYDSIDKYDTGLTINPSYLATFVQDRTWEDNPINLEKEIKI